MALKIATRTTQSRQVATFQWQWNDTMVPVAGGAAVDFGLTNTAATSVMVIPLPPNSIVIGGSLIRQQAFDTASYNVTVGDSSSANRYLGTTDVKALGSTALVPTGFLNEAGLNIQLTFTNADACTAGKAILVVEYVILGRAMEVQIA